MPEHRCPNNLLFECYACHCSRSVFYVRFSFLDSVLHFSYLCRHPLPFALVRLSGHAPLLSRPGLCFASYLLLILVIRLYPRIP